MTSNPRLSFGQQVESVAATTRQLRVADSKWTGIIAEREALQSRTASGKFAMQQVPTA